MLMTIAIHSYDNNGNRCIYTSELLTLYSI